jgi:hypothetical protein
LFIKSSVEECSPVAARAIHVVPGAILGCEHDASPIRHESPTKNPHDVRVYWILQPLPVPVKGHDGTFRGIWG